MQSWGVNKSGFAPFDHLRTSALSRAEGEIKSEKRAAVTGAQASRLPMPPLALSWSLQARTLALQSTSVLNSCV